LCGIPAINLAHNSGDETLSYLPGTEAAPASFEEAGDERRLFSDR
jgi:hypothetical protein